jgi:hypothetical protein
MFRHGPTCLDGPLTKDRAWWSGGEAHVFATASQGSTSVNDFRPELVQRVRAEIAAGTYDTPEKWDLALERLLDRLSQE